jgi:hypothetical protein
VWRTLYGKVVLLRCRLSCRYQARSEVGQ